MNCILYTSLNKNNNIKIAIQNKHCYRCTVVNKDTVEVIVFDPHEADSSVRQDGRQSPFLFLVHQESHEVLNFWHVHISTVISAHQDLQRVEHRIEQDHTEVL